MTESERFFIEKQAAIERMRELSRRSSDFGIPAPSFVKGRGPHDRHEPPAGEAPPDKKDHKPHRPPVENARPQNPADFLKSLLPGIDLPFFGGENEGDLSLLLALMLLLFDDGCDRLLLYALIYILL